MNHAKILTVILAVLPGLVLAGNATEPSTRPSTSPATAPASAPTSAPARGTYLGVAVTPLEQAIAKQRNLAPGTGLQILYVLPKSPAGIAGIAKDDVLTKLDDHAITGTAQLTTLVRTYKPGQTVTVKVLRGKEEKSFQVLLAELTVTPPTVEEILSANDKDKAAPVDPPTRLFVTQLIIVDKENELTLNLAGGKRILTVKDKAGATVFSGPVLTAEDRKKLPAEFLDKLQMMEKSLESMKGISTSQQAK